MTAPTRPPPTRRWPAIAALAATLGAAALGGLLHTRMLAQTAAAAAAAGPFDLDQAMDLAGSAVPPDVESFYFFVLERDAPDESNELALKLGQAADEHDFVGIAGADAQHNRRVLLAALAAARGRSLSGLVIIYVGPPEHEAELNAAIRAAGAELRFVRYSSAPLKVRETI